MLGAGEPREITGAFVSDGLFDMLGLRVAIGRGFRPEENQPGQGQVALLSHGFWQRVFGGDPAVLGRTVTSAGIAYTIIGVTTPESSLPDQADAYFPLEYTDIYDATTQQGRRSEFLSVLGAREGRRRCGGDRRRFEAHRRRSCKRRFHNRTTG